MGAAASGGQTSWPEVKHAHHVGEVSCLLLQRPRGGGGGGLLD